MSHKLCLPLNSHTAKWWLRLCGLVFFLTSAFSSYAQGRCPDGSIPRPWFLDRDGDGFYAKTTGSTLLCASPGAGWTDRTSGQDCDDYKKTYEDLDNDGHGSMVKIPCGSILTSDDCDDGNRRVYKPQIFFADKDGDSYGDKNNPDAPLCSSVPPSGSVKNNYDCNDKNGYARMRGEKFYGKDGDSDGAGSMTDKMDACDADKTPPDHVPDATDCNDKNKDVKKRGEKFYYDDNDGDTWGDLKAKVDACDYDARPTGYVDRHGDCNDDNKEVHVKGTVFYFRDGDGDRFGSKLAADKVDACGVNLLPNGTLPPGFAVAADDCNDANKDVQVANTKFYYPDVDGDGYGDGRFPLDWCRVSKGQPNCTVTDKTDEDDNALTFIDFDCDKWGSTTKTPKKPSTARPCIATNNADPDDTKNSVRAPAGTAEKLPIANCRVPPPPYRTQVSDRPDLAEVFPPAQFTLSAGPNPFSLNLQIHYQLPQAATVNIKLYDILGREVGLLFNGKRMAGTFSTVYNTSHFGQGIYYCRMVATVNGEVFTKTQTLMKTR